MAIYMKFEGIEGNVTEEGHKKWIEVNSLQFGLGRGISAAVGAQQNREASAPSISEVTVTKPLDSASVDLLKEALTEIKGKTVELDFTRTDKSAAVYLKITLTNTLISGFSSSSGGDRPSESISLNFTKIEYRATEGGDDNTAASAKTATYDLAAAKAG